VGINQRDCPYDATRVSCCPGSREYIDGMRCDVYDAALAFNGSIARDRLADL